MKRIFLLLLASFSLLTIQAQDFAVKELNASPRHQEWIKVKSGDRDVNCFVVYPETSKKATVVIAIHENRGLTDWVRSFADQLAGKGFIVIAPDLLSDFGPYLSRTSDFKSSDEARNAIYALTPDQVMNDLNAVQNYASQIPAGNGKTSVIGFCWGGTQSFRMATYNHDIKAALVFYGSAPDKKGIKQIAAPIYGFYGGNDQRINAGIPETEKLMKEAGKSYDYVIYEGAGHAYMRQGDDPKGSAENKTARDKSWERLLKILKAT
ncbi:dienelactone hydrolase family protein [Saccharicrinis sp. FJH62]|uniref:dienelactone hydrolase family protein n=1 Tax=Saccharicrinis sp. FJH62 TaxID=3344657 RepID=UPI0035D501AB